MDDATRVVRLEVGPAGEPIAGLRGLACAAHDAENLYLAVRCTVPKGYKPVAGGDWGGDGIEVSFRVAEGERRTPIFVLWGTVDGSISTSPAGGATLESLGILQAGTVHRVQVGEDAWTSEWSIPLTKLGIDPARDKRLLLNIGYRCLAGDLWIAWQATGGALYEVDSAGELVLE